MLQMTGRSEKLLERTSPRKSLLWITNKVKSYLANSGNLSLINDQLRKCLSSFTCMEMLGVDLRLRLMSLTYFLLESIYSHLISVDVEEVKATILLLAGKKEET